MKTIRLGDIRMLEAVAVKQFDVGRGSTSNAGAVESAARHVQQNVDLKGIDSDEKQGGRGGSLGAEDG